MTITDFLPASDMRGSPMRSPGAVYGALAILLALPLAILSSVVLGGGDAVVVHAAFGTGMLMLAASVFDFRVPKVIGWAGGIAMFVLGAIFLAQGLAELLQSPALFGIVYGDMTIQAIEKNAVYPILIWCLAIVLGDSRGKSRVLGMLSLAAVGLAEAYGVWCAVNGTAPDIMVRLVYLWVFAWLAIEGRKPALMALWRAA